jgi:hypothetical protein
VFGAMLALPASASAAVLTYYPSGSATGTNDLGDLDHQFYYAWTITGIPTVPAGQQITSAYLTFKNLYNWDNTANMLFLDLSDKVATGGQFVSSGSGDANGATTGGAYTSTIRKDQDSTQAPVTTIVDAFDSSTNTLLPTTSKINLTEHAFLPGDSINGTYNDPSQSADISWLRNLLTTAGLPGVDAEFGATNPQWSFAANGSGFDYTYQFTSSQMTTLTSYINGSGADTGAISIAFDPDCHFYNDGVSFTLVTGNAATAAVPEPASLMLLGTGLLLTANRYRRRRASKAAK